MPALGSLVRTPLRLARRASVALRRVLVVILLAGVYGLAIPWVWVWLRVRGARPAGWVTRNDRSVGALERLRQPF
jgi:hypothetical protein